MLRDILLHIRTIGIPAGGPEVARTVAGEIRAGVARDAAVVTDPAAGAGTLRLLLGTAPGTPTDGAWMFCRIDADGGGLLAASHPRHLYALVRLLLEEWLDEDARLFAHGRTLRPAIPWFRAHSDFLVGSLRFTRSLDRAGAVRDFARAGFTHLTINGLGVPAPFESGPPGDVYSCFYDYSPDLDQFVTSPLTADTFPAAYREANLRFLRDLAAEARRYGLVPGLHVNSPRSMPESFWERHPHLRGPRIDHPRESFRPRYAMTVAHPAVRDHYRAMLEGLLHEVPELGFLQLWTNDSGAGFEFVSTLYAGRNGGPYLLREWKDPGSIERAAAENVLRFLHLLRDTGRRARPEFRVICDLGPFSAERHFLLPGFGNGLDAGEFAFFEDAATAADLEQIRAGGSWVHEKVEFAGTNVLGLPFPSVAAERLRAIRDRGGVAVLAAVTPASLSPFDINREVIRDIQLGVTDSADASVKRWAHTWAGPALAAELTALWSLSDHAVRAYPDGIPMSTVGFPWFRLWIRPFVPDIDAIPEKERRYYEEYLLATFNNPARVDLNNDMLWNFLTPREAGEKRVHIDQSVLPHFDDARARCEAVLQRTAGSTPPVFADLLARLRAGRCFFATMRNTMAWTESVHGFLRATSADERDRCRTLCRAMIDHELANTRDLLDLLRTSTVEVIPIATTGESLHAYGLTMPVHLERKIALMERHRNDEPRIDPEYMWKMT
jgi:hypothetical protein